MSLSIDGNSLIFDGTVTFTNAFDPNTGVVTMILTPTGGISGLGALLAGESGPPSPPRNVYVNVIAPAATPAAPVVTIVSPGSPGVAAVWDLTFEVNQGDDGAPGTLTIGSATDITGTPTDTYTLAYQTSDSKFHYVPRKVGGLLVPASVAATSSTTTTPRTLVGISVSSYPFDWWPRVFAEVPVNSSATDTHVDLVARLNDASSGDQVGYGTGVTGANPPPVQICGTGYGSVLSGSYGKVLAGQAAQIYVVAVQTGPSGNSWSTSAGSVTVEVKPVP